MKTVFSVATCLLVCSLGSAALAADKDFTPAASPQTLKPLVLYPGAFRLTGAQAKAKVDASVNKIFAAINVKCSSVEEIFWGSKVEHDKIAAGFKLQMDKLKYSYEVVQKLKNGSIVKIKAGNQQLHGMWNFTPKSTMLALCK